MFFSSSSFRHPIEYHRNNITKKSRDHIIHSYVGTVAIAALIFCIPKFFESKVIGITEKKLTFDTISNMSEMVSNAVVFISFNPGVKTLPLIKQNLNYQVFLIYRSIRLNIRLTFPIYGLTDITCWYTTLQSSNWLQVKI